MDLVLFFLDTFLWYIIWNTVYSIARSFMLGLVDLDAVEGYLCSPAEAYILQDPGNVGFRGPVQAQGVFIILS
jgi:hypothetical protein